MSNPICPKCGIGHLAGLRYVPDTFTQCPSNALKSMTGTLIPEHLLVMCNKCGYGEKRDVEDKDERARKDIIRAAMDTRGKERDPDRSCTHDRIDWRAVRGHVIQCPDCRRSWYGEGYKL